MPRTTHTLPLGESGVVLATDTAASWLFLLLHRDRLLAPSLRFRLDGTRVINIGRGTARAVQRDKETLEISIDDPWASTQHVRLVRDGKRFCLEDAGSRNGTTRNGVRSCARAGSAK